MNKTVWTRIILVVIIFGLGFLAFWSGCLHQAQPK